MFEYLICYFIKCNYENNSENFIDYMGNVNIINHIFSLLVSFSTAYLAYQCNLKNGIIQRTILTILAFFFSGIYLIYYLLTHIVFGKQCDTKPINISKIGKRGKKLKNNIVKDLKRYQ